jgi:hypothetical protein
VINASVRVTLSVEISVRRPAFTDDRSARFDPNIYNGHQCVSGSVRYWNKKSSARLTFDTAEHPLALNRVSPIVLWPTEHALVDFNGLVRTADLFRAAFTKTSIVSLQNMPQSVTLAELQPCSSWIRWARSRLTMSYVRCCTSWKVRRLCWNHEPCLMAFDGEHLASATFRRHRHLKPSVVVGSAHQVISRPQVLHGTLLRIRTASFRKWIPRSLSLNRNVRKPAFTQPLLPNAQCPYDLLGTNGISTIRR